MILLPIFEKTQFLKLEVSVNLIEIEPFFTFLW
jgi:hypothetical protein